LTLHKDTIDATSEEVRTITKQVDRDRVGEENRAYLSFLSEVWVLVLR
jgi:hypothetical protein